MENAVKKLLDLIQREGVDRFGRHHMDFSKEEHRECFYEMFGGQEHMEKEYPDLYALALKTAQCKKKIQKDDEDSLEDFIMISDTFSDESKTGAVGITGLTAPAKRLFQSITLVQDDEVIGRQREFYNNEERKELNCEIDSSSLKSKKDKITCVFNSVWQDGTDGLLRSDTSVRKDIIPFEDYVDGIEVVHPCYYYGNSMDDLPPVPEDATTKQEIRWPKNEIKPRTDEIRVAYARQRFTDPIDYNYPQKMEGHLREVFLDVQGQVTLSAGYEYERFESAMIVLDFVDKEFISGDGGVLYNATIKDNIHIYPFSENGVNGFCFAFPTDWKATIPNSSFAASKTIYFEAEIDFYCKNCEDPGSVYITSSDIQDAGKNIFKIPKINLMWGCLEKNVPVTMADGSTKKISEIVQGDEVLCEDGSISRVTDVICGSEEELVYVKAEGYDSVIGASMEHPFLTEEGSIKACHITPDTLIKMDDGKYHGIEECYRSPYHDRVYNLELDGAHWFYGGHYVVGDNVAQGECEKKLNDKATLQKDEAVLLEIEKLRREFA